MRVAGITAEYNPFHNGHVYHLQKTRELTGADAVVAVMSGSWVQRGVPAAVDKYRRTRMALEAGVDLVLELPVKYATGSAEAFASGAVSILHDLGVVTDIVYGCEASADEMPLIRELAELLVSEPEDYRTLLQDGLRTGMNFPAARQAALEQVLPSAAHLLSTPNNILAVEYEKALLRLGSDIHTAGIQRNDSGYHVTGSAIREALRTGDRSQLASQLPAASLAQLDYYMDADDLSSALAYRLLTVPQDELTGYQDVTPEIAARISRHCADDHGFSQLTERISARNIPAAHVRRALLHILLGLRADTPEPGFIRVLGFRKDSALLHYIKQSSSRPLMSKLADAPAGSWDADERASHIYNRLVYDRTGLRLPDEYHAGPVIL